MRFILTLLRFNKEHWINLLTLPILNNTAINLSLENELIKYLKDHKYYLLIFINYLILDLIGQAEKKN